MARLSSFTCDQCGTLKRETNGWWLIAQANSAVSVCTWGDEKDADGIIHACGIECVQKIVARWMGEQGHS